MPTDICAVGVRGGRRFGTAADRVRERAVGIDKATVRSKWRCMARMQSLRLYRTGDREVLGQLSPPRKVPSLESTASRLGITFRIIIIIVSVYSKGTGITTLCQSTQNQTSTAFSSKIAVSSWVRVTVRARFVTCRVIRVRVSAAVRFTIRVKVDPTGLMSAMTGSPH